MKTIFNTTKIISASSIGMLVLAFVVSTPSMALPADRVTTTEQGSGEACSRFTTLGTSTNAKLTERIAAMKVDFAKRLSNIDSRHEAVDQKVITFRTSLSDKFDAKLVELRKTAGLTDAKLAAIDTYEQAMKTAEAAREEAVDSARATYRTALAKEVTDHQAKLSEAATTFQSSINTAFTTAKADCGNGSAATTLKTSVKTARDVFQTSRKAAAAKSSITQLATTRTESIKAADAEFKKNAESYTTTIKNVL